MKNPTLIKKTAKAHLPHVTEYALLCELERRIEMITNNQNYSKEFVAKLETLKKAAEAVKVYF